MTENFVTFDLAKRRLRTWGSLEDRQISVYRLWKIFENLIRTILGDFWAVTAS